MKQQERRAYSFYVAKIDEFSVYADNMIKFVPKSIR